MAVRAAACGPRTIAALAASAVARGARAGRALRTPRAARPLRRRPRDAAHAARANGSGVPAAAGRASSAAPRGRPYTPMDDATSTSTSRTRATSRSSASRAAAASASTSSIAGAPSTSTASRASSCRRAEQARSRELDDDAAPAHAAAAVDLQGSDEQGHRRRAVGALPQARRRAGAGAAAPRRSAALHCPSAGDCFPWRCPAASSPPSRCGMDSLAPRARARTGSFVRRPHRAPASRTSTSSAATASRRGSR